jgi:transcriptional regulator with XRE-family HTH domain
MDTKVNVPSQLGIKIQQARTLKKLTQDDLAKLMGCQSSFITNYEKGTAIPTNQFISKLETKLNVKLPRVKKIKIHKKDI